MNGPFFFVAAVNGPVAKVRLRRTNGQPFSLTPKVECTFPKPMGVLCAIKGAQNYLCTFCCFFAEKHSVLRAAGTAPIMNCFMTTRFPSLSCS